MYVKKNNQDKTTLVSDTVIKNVETGRIKTTNVNILLNRVRIEKRTTMKKRIIFSIIVISLVSSLAIYFII
tara:strand:+ start:455 stop:667 length:213 start_codon:yes stop_codon:yes gene_type:complete